MENKKSKFVKLINEFIIYRMEEELNLIQELKKQNESKINDKKLNLNLIYKKKCSSLENEYKFKKEVYDGFICNCKEERINEDEFDSFLKSAFKKDSIDVKRYCFFLQNYFINLYSASMYEERNRAASLKDIIKELELDDSLFLFVKKTMKKNLKVIGASNILKFLTNDKMIFNIEQFFPFATTLMDEDIEIENDSLLEEIIVHDKVLFSLKGEKRIIDISLDDLKKHCFLFLMISDYISNYSLKNGDGHRIFVSSFLKYKNIYEHQIIEENIFDEEKEQKLNLLNKVIMEINSN